MGNESMDIDQKFRDMNLHKENNSEAHDNLAWLRSYNNDIHEIMAKNILIPIRDIILGDISFAQKVL